MATLERAAGVRLLERPGGRRPVVPTDAGERILRHAVRLTAQLQAAEADLTALAEGTAETLRVGTFQSVSIRVLPDVVRRLMQVRPGIEVRLQEAPYEDELLALVERGRLDFTFALVPPEGPFEHVELLRDPYVLLDAGGHVRSRSARARRRSPRSAGCRSSPTAAAPTASRRCCARAASSRTSSSAATRAARCSAWSRRASARRSSRASRSTTASRAWWRSTPRAAFRRGRSASRGIATRRSRRPPPTSSPRCGRAATNSPEPLKLPPCTREDERRRGGADAGGDADRRGRLPRAQRRHPRGDAAPGRRRRRAGRRAARLARA